MINFTNSSDGPGEYDDGTNKFVSFTGTSAEKLTNTTFKGLNSSTEFTKIIVYTTTSSTSMALEDAMLLAMKVSGLMETYTLKQTVMIADTWRCRRHREALKVQVTRFDSNSSGLKNILDTRINSTFYEYTSFNNNKLRAPGDNAGMVVSGRASDNSYSHKGNIGEVIFFDRKLNFDETLLIEKYLMRKYGITNGCSAPANSTRYDFTSCDTTNGNLSVAECTLSCKDGYSQLGALKPTAVCSANGGTFSASGCYTDAEMATPTRLSSCRYASSEGLYRVNFIDEDGNSNTDQVVYCDYDSSSEEGSLNLIKTMGITASSDFAKSFFVTNNNSSIEVSQAVNTEGKLGILVKNLGENLGSTTLTEGFHITQAPARYSTVNLEFAMKGANRTNLCTSSYWLPLNGHGVGGNTNSYLSSCLTGKTCVQGRPKSGSDVSIRASYEDTDFEEDEVLTFSGGGKASSETSTECAADSLIPGNAPATFITTLNIVDKASKLCKIENVAGYDFTCSGSPSDGRYREEACSLECANGYSTSLEVPLGFDCEQTGNNFKLYGCFDGSGTTDVELAEHIIRTKNVLHFDASVGVNLDGNDETLSWESKPDKDGNVHTVRTTANGQPLQLIMAQLSYLGLVDIIVNLLKVHSEA